MFPNHFCTELTPHHLLALCGHYNFEVQGTFHAENTMAYTPPWLDAIPLLTVLDNKRSTGELSWAWLALGQQTTPGKGTCLWKCCLLEASGGCYFLNTPVFGPARLMDIKCWSYSIFPYLSECNTLTLSFSDHQSYVLLNVRN